MTRRSPCRWLSWDEFGRPSCEHGPASKSGSQFRCCWKHREANVVYRARTGYAAEKKYEASEKGRAARARSNQKDSTKSRKQLYELTRIRTF